MKNLIWLMLFCSSVAYSQNTFRARIIDADSKEPLVGATLQISDTQGDVADTTGLVEITGITSSTINVKVSFVGYDTFTETYSLPLNEIVIIAMEHDHEFEEVIVTATRSSRTIEDLPTRVEVLATEELEEKAMMRSANIAMVLRESTGIQMQTTSATSAAQSIRIQGLEGRYTQILKDGFPVYGGFSSGLSIMQIPPLDLKQIEVVKGSSSTLYGGGAIAGLVNLVSITPEAERKLKFMIDQTNAGGTTFNSFYAEKYGKVGLTFYASANRQEAYDPNDDFFSDIPRIRSLTLNPSLFVDFNDRSSLRFSYNGTFENRQGGDVQMIDGGPGTHNFTEENKSNRQSLQLTFTSQVDENQLLTLKSSLTQFDREILGISTLFSGEQWSSFSELSYAFGEQKSRWITGLNLYTDSFSELPTGIPARDYNYTTLGAFAQNTTVLSDKVSLESGLRFDYDFDFGFFALPRISLLAKFSNRWTARVGGGLGYKQPTIFSEDAEHLAYRLVMPIDLNATEAERSVGGNLDVNFNTALGDDLTLSINQLFFYTRLSDALVFRNIGRFQFFYENADGAVTSDGLETNIKLGYKDFKLFANYAFINTRLRFDNQNRQQPLTPKHNIGLVAMYEEHGKWRIGYEAYYTGRQFRRDGTETSDFWYMGVMAMRKFGNIALYVNFENFTDTRQHSLETFNINEHLIPEFPDIWAPIDGFIINGGLILELE